MMRTGFRKLYFLSYFSITYLTRFSAHGNESATTQLESESASALCTKMSAARVLNFNSVSRRSYKSKEATTHRGSEFENQIF